VVAGLAAFACYAAIFELAGPRVPPEAEITVLTILLQGMGYLIAMAVANICYLLGPLAERVFEPRSPERFRRRAFAWGFWFSVVLPFAAPIAFAISCFRP
jgi:hypothetical protein